MKAALLRIHLLVRPPSTEHVAETACSRRGTLRQPPGMIPWIITSSGNNLITTDPDEVTCHACRRKMK